MSTEKQRELPFDRRAMNRLIDNADFPCGRRSVVIKALLRELVFFHGNKPAGVDGPPLEHLSKVLGCTKRTIQRALREAEALGVVTVEPRIGRDGRRANRYTVHRAALSGYGTADDLVWDGHPVTGDNLTPDPCQSVTGQVSDCHGTRDNLTPDPCQSVTSYKEETSKTNKTSKDHGARAPAEEELGDVMAWWNRLRGDGLVAAGVDADRPAGAVLSGWQRVQKLPELRRLFEDLPSVERAIRESRFVHNAGWFTLAKLLGGKNKTGELILLRLLEGGYRDDDRTRADLGESHVHPDDVGRW